MYLDADISHINFGQSFTNENYEQYNLYDVYNHGTDMDGILKVKFDRSLIVRNNETVVQATSYVHPKMKNRKNLSEVKIRIGVQVI